MRRGRSDSTRFVQGDFLDVSGQLSSADIVTLDRVVCCYPEYERFLEASLRHAGRIFALSYPLDLWYVRMWVSLQNVARAIIRNAFRSFIHPVSAMENVIRREGFTLLDWTDGALVEHAYGTADRRALDEMRAGPTGRCGV